jgi:hypothetical protein
MPDLSQTTSTTTNSFMQQKIQHCRKKNSLVGFAFPGKPETISVPMVTGMCAEDLREEMGSIFSIG